jgi:hypothetical protein
VGFKGAAFLIVNLILPANVFHSRKYKPAPFTKTVKSAAPDGKADPLLQFPPLAPPCAKRARIA